VVAQGDVAGLAVGGYRVRADPARSAAPRCRRPGRGPAPWTASPVGAYNDVRGRQRGLSVGLYNDARELRACSSGS
jgi:hypothetical protein